MTPAIEDYYQVSEICEDNLEIVVLLLRKHNCKMKPSRIYKALENLQLNQYTTCFNNILDTPIQIINEQIKDIKRSLAIARATIELISFEIEYRKKPNKNCYQYFIKVNLNEQ